MPGVERLEVPAQSAGSRLDRFLAQRFPALSRARLAALIHEGHVRVAGASAKPARRVSSGELVEIEIVPPPPLAARPVDLPLEIRYEDEHVVVVNKPAGLVVHPGAGTRASEATLAGALVHRYGKLPLPPGREGAARPGIVHRLDKGTSGLLVVARNEAAHRSLAEQFAARTVEKTYLALVHGKLKSPAGTIRLAVARDLHRRTRMTTRRRPEAGRASRTDWRALAVIGNFTLVEVALRTGRTHQIRVHFSALGHPVAGDTLYGAPKNSVPVAIAPAGPEPAAAGRASRAGQSSRPSHVPSRDAGATTRVASAAPALTRPFLHAVRLAFTHPVSGERIEARAPLPADLRDFLAELAAAAGVPAAQIDAALRGYL